MSGFLLTMAAVIMAFGTGMFVRVINPLAIMVLGSLNGLLVVAAMTATALGK